MMVLMIVVLRMLLVGIFGLLMVVVSMVLVFFHCCIYLIKCGMGKHDGVHNDKFEVVIHIVFWLVN